MIDAVTILAAVLAALLATVILTLGFLRRSFTVRRRRCPYCGEVTEDCRLSVRRRPRAGPAKKASNMRPKFTMNFAQSTLALQRIDDAGGRFAHPNPVGHQYAGDERP